MSILNIFPPVSSSHFNFGGPCHPVVRNLMRFVGLGFIAMAASFAGYSEVGVELWYSVTLILSVAEPHDKTSEKSYQ